MGTRSQVLLIGRTAYDRDAVGKYEVAITLYRHWDGDGLTMMKDVLGAIQRAETKIVNDIRFRTDNARHISAPVMQALLVAEASGANDVFLSQESVFRSAPRMNHLASQSDLEWFYVIDCEKKVFNIYSIKKLGEDATRGYSDAIGHISAGALADPISWETSLRHGDTKGYDRGPDIAQAQLVLEELRKTGWSICETEDPYFKLVRKQVKDMETKSLIAESKQAVNSAYCI